MTSPPSARHFCGGQGLHAMLPSFTAALLKSCLCPHTPVPAPAAAPAAACFTCYSFTATLSTLSLALHCLVLKCCPCPSSCHCCCCCCCCWCCFAVSHTFILVPYIQNSRMRKTACTFIFLHIWGKLWNGNSALQQTGQHINKIAERQLRSGACISLSWQGIAAEIE